jgi:hypothetical protein
MKINKRYKKVKKWQVVNSGRKKKPPSSQGLLDWSQPMVSITFY